MWLDLWLTLANQEKRIWTMCCGTAHWQLPKIVVGYSSLCLVMLAVGWSREYVMKRQQTSVGGSFVQGMTSPFNLSDRLRICKAWRGQAVQRQRAFKRKRTYIWDVNRPLSDWERQSACPWSKGSLRTNGLESVPVTQSLLGWWMEEEGPPRKENPMFPGLNLVTPELI